MHDKHVAWETILNPTSVNHLLFLLGIFINPQLKCASEARQQTISGEPSDAVPFLRKKRKASYLTR